MPRKRAVVLRGGDLQEDLERAEAIRGDASGSTALASRLLGYLSEYLEGKDTKIPADILWEGFLGRLSSGLGSSTMTTYLTTMNAYGIHPATMDLAASRIRRRSLISGIERRDKGTDLRQWRVPCGLDDLRRIIEHQHEREGDLDYRTLFYVCVATGGRAENITVAHEIRCCEDGLAVLWGRRKVRPPSRAALRYPFAWSFAPPDAVRQRIGTLSEKSWFFAKSNNVAAALNAWINRRTVKLSIDVHLTSTVGRARLSALLSKGVETGDMSRERFEDLLDHELEMSRRRYQVGIIE